MLRLYFCIKTFLFQPDEPAPTSAVADTPVATATDSLAVTAVTTESPGTPGATESPGTVSENLGALSENPATSMTSTDVTGGAPEASPSVQATGTTPLLTARSEVSSEPATTTAPASTAAEQQPDSEPQPEPEPVVAAAPGSETATEPEPEPPEPPERRGAAVVSEYCWSSDQPGRVMLTLGRRCPDSGAICLPPGCVPRLSSMAGCNERPLSCMRAYNSAD